MAGSEPTLNMILFLLLGFGSNSRDLVSYLNPDDYFASRQVDVKVETLLDLAARSPATGKDQVMQLLAIRKLVADPAQARKDGRVRNLLTQIVQGKKGKDRLGFAEDYARRALAQLDGKPAPVATMPKASLRSDAFAWFPKEAALVAGFDLRPVAGVPAVDVSGLQELANKFLKQENLDKVLEAVEKLGNIRLDRFCVGLAPNPQGGGDGKSNGRIYVRITGKADHQRLISFLSDTVKVPIVRQERDPGQEMITYLRQIDHPPAIAVIGDSELLIAGYMNEEGDHLGVLREMLEVRAGKRAGVGVGPLVARLKKVHPQTFILMAGDISKDLGLGPLGAPGIDGKGTLPKSVVMEATRKAAGLDIALEAVMENEADAQRLADEAKRALRESVESARRELKSKPDVPKELIELVVETLESVKTKAKSTSLSISVHISNKVMKAIPDLLGKLGVVPGGSAPEFQQGPGGVKQFKQAPQAPVGAAGQRTRMSPRATRGIAAVTAVPRSSERSTRRAAPLSV